MKIIARHNLDAAMKEYPDVRKQIERWSAVVKAATWQHVGEVRQAYNSADPVGNFTVFNIKGNKYRLIVGIDYEIQTVFCRYFLTHADYDKGRWKNDPYF